MLLPRLSVSGRPVAWVSMLTRVTCRQLSGRAIGAVRQAILGLLSILTLIRVLNRQTIDRVKTIDRLISERLILSICLLISSVLRQALMLGALRLSVLIPQANLIPALPCRPTPLL